MKNLKTIQNIWSERCISCLVAFPFFSKHTEIPILIIPIAWELQQTAGQEAVNGNGGFSL